MAAMPYMGSSAYGGYVSYMGETLGIDLGVERVYDPYLRRWTTVPIVTPAINFGRGVVVRLPVGWLVKDVLDRAVFGKQPPRNPTILFCLVAKSFITPCLSACTAPHAPCRCLVSRFFICRAAPSVRCGLLCTPHTL